VAYKKYQCRFYSENKVGGAYVSPPSADPNQQRWEIAIWKETGSGSTTDFKCTSSAFTLKMDGGDDNLASPIKTTSVEFDMILETASQEQIIDDILSVATGNENEFWVQIAMYNTTTSTWENFWRGVLLGDLVSVQDVGINRIIKVQATDGLTQLKYKSFDPSTYGGLKSCMNLIKVCLGRINLIAARYGGSDRMIAHTPFYYCKAMSGGLTGAAGVDSDTWRENVDHDPLCLTNVNTEIFKYDDGTYWSYYEILEQVLSTFQLRIMMTMIEDDAGNVGPMWLLQSPFVYHDYSGNQDTDNLTFFHPNNLTTESASGYKATFSTKLVNPAERLSGGITTYLPPLKQYKTIYNHKIMQNLALGPLSFNSSEYNDANLTDLTDHYINTPTNGFVYNLSKNTEDTQVVGFGGFAENSNTTILITGDLEYYPEVWSAWDWFEENNLSVSFGNITNVAWLDQLVFARMGLMVSSRSEFVSDGTPSIFYNYYWYGMSRFGIAAGSIGWIGPSETLNGSYPAYWNITYPAVWSYTELDTGNTIYPYGTDTGVDGGYWYSTAQTIGAMDHWAWFSPHFHQVGGNNGMVLGSAGSGTDESTFNTMWSNYNYQNGLSTGTISFSKITPYVPIVGDQYGFVPTTGGFIQTLRLYYAFKRDKWYTGDTTGGGSNISRYLCHLDWSNQGEAEHKNRGIGFGYNLNNVRVYLLGNQNEQDGYFDYSIGYFENNNGTPSESETQDPEIIIGDQPDFDASQNYVGTDNIGVSPTYFGQFWITNTNGITSPSLPYYTGVDTTRWICTWESDNSGNWLKLHEKRCKMQVTHHYKLKEKLDLLFKDRSPTTSYATDFKMTKYGFSAIYNWYGAGSTENTTWIDNLYMVSGGEFIAGTMEWKVQLVDCLTFSQSNIVNNSYSSNNTD
tara:strand:+ start:16043 stop:18763 length:2721 start_codon:yes stop_codon:yes gene_type:complete